MAGEEVSAEQPKPEIKATKNQKSAEPTKRGENRHQKKSSRGSGGFEKTTRPVDISVPPRAATTTHQQGKNESSSSSSAATAVASNPSPTRPITDLKDVNIKLDRFNDLTRGDQRQTLDGPPPLPFRLREHLFSIWFFAFLCFCECCFVPLGLYYGLTDGTNMRSGIKFAIITSLFGFVSGYEFTARSWRILRYGDNYRPLHGSQYFRGFDATQYVLLTPFVIMTIVQVVFSIPTHPSVKALALPMPVGVIVLAVIMAANGWAAHRRWRLLHFRLSSHVRNAVCPPLTFVFMEDICAVDGRGGKKYRKAAMARYNGSPRFRSLLMQMLWFWSLSGILVNAAVIAVIWVPVVSDDIAYGVGWAVPCVWIALWTWITVIWVQRALRIEKETWIPDRVPTA